MEATKIKNIANILNSNLPGEYAHTELMPVNRPYSSMVRNSADSYRHSAVAIILYESNYELESILIQRPKYEGAHSNQIAFPGGKMDDTDSSLEHTARRECMEEIGIPFDAPKLLGALTDIYIPVSRYIVKPYVFHLEKLPDLIPDQREVETIIPFRLKELLSEDILKSTSMKMGNGLTQKNVPYYNIQNQMVWGATGMMLAEFRAILRLV